MGNIPHIYEIKSHHIVLYNFQKKHALDEFQKEMTAASADWQLHSYGNAYHAFTSPDANDPDFGTQYNKEADTRSWQSMHNFFSEIF